MPGLKTPPCFERPTAGSRGASSPDYAATAQGPLGSQAPGGCACTRFFWIRAIPNACSSPSRPPAPSGATTLARRGGLSTADWCPKRSPTRLLRSATAFTASRCTGRVRMCCSCRSTGTSCAVTTAASRGMRSAETCRPTSGFRSTFTRTSRTPSMSFRSRATRSTIRPMGSCAYIAAGRAETSGRRSRMACRKATATLTCCATR